MKCDNCGADVSFIFYPRGEHNYCTGKCLAEAHLKHWDGPGYVAQAEDDERDFEDWWTRRSPTKLPTEDIRAAWEAGALAEWRRPKYDD